MIIETDREKLLFSPEYNFTFDRETGHFERWGKTTKDDPAYSEFGPEILDLEISTICHGPKTKEGKNKVCNFCYKNNDPTGKKMTFDAFKGIFDKLPKTVTQIAFGIGDMPENSFDDMWEMFKYCRDNGVIPNVTTNGYGLTPINLQLLGKYCGGVAVSHYHDTDACFDAVRRISIAGVRQVNIHKVLSMETIEECHHLIDAAADNYDMRIHLKAIVFLTLKPKGKRNTHNTIKDVAEYKRLIDHANARGVQMGMDSCSAKMYLMAMKEHPRFKEFSQMVESCESTLFSFYANVDGEFFPCSFTEGEYGWETGVKIDTDFIKDVWMNERVVEFRNKNLATTDLSVCGDCRSCVTFPEIDPSNWTENTKVDILGKHNIAVVEKS